MSEIELQRVVKVYPDGTPAVRGVDLTIASGEFVVLVGPSGCGKSTLLRMIAGLEAVTEGRIVIGGRDVTQASPRDRDIAMVFQNYALYPHMSVRQNLGFSLKVRKAPKSEITQKVDDAAKLLGLSDLLNRKPGQLSGGQRQRVAMGRAIVREPLAYLMDEPLSNLDAQLRVTMRAELTNIHHRLGVTTVYVTHDQVEAMTLGQRVAVLDDGLIQQVDRPQHLYRQPANVFVAKFIGSPSMNLVRATVKDGHMHIGQHRVPVHPSHVELLAGRDEVIVGLRPESFKSAADADATHPTIDVEISALEDLGTESHAFFTVDAPPVKAGATLTIGEEDLFVGPDSVRFIARLPSTTTVQLGATVPLSVDTASCYFFDPVDQTSLLPAGALVG
ncbi:MAG TPA: sn-glycerol-3-phosphate ABC transporter ATP-binding protein UgpC [Actinomycetes bacterium]|nr:sn-glycerol-3-phosphate ABC transporter ATP-binding protein UgpC [Actinomycetes bacterium]